MVIGPASPVSDIVVGTDFSAESAGALRMALDVGGALSARVHLVYVVEPLNDADEAAVPRLSARHMEMAWEEMALFVRGHGAEGRVETKVVRGEAESELIAEARRLKAGLIVVGRYGKGGLKRGTIGSIAARLTRKSPVSVLLAVPEYHGPVRKVGVACDFSDAAGAALSRGVQLCRAMWLQRLDVLHAWDFPAGLHTMMSEAQYRRLVEETARSKVDEARKAMGVDGPAGPQLELVTRTGNPGEAIPGMAEERHLDLLVESMHQRTGAAMFLLPRVTERVIDRIGCSLWVERNPAMFYRFLTALQEVVGLGDDDA